VLWRD
jgi:hypothetical protein